jgi:hypothetical protein
MNIPDFKEVYKRIEKPDKWLTICELRDMTTNKVIAYGKNAVGKEKKYNKELAKLLSYAKAMRFLTSHFSNQIIEDKIASEK